MEKTRYIDLKSIKDYLAQEIKFRGWIHNKRSSGSILFLTLRDGSAFVQGIINKSDFSNDYFNEIEKLGMESSIEGIGIVREEKRAPGGYEIIIKNLKVIQSSNNYPIQKKKDGSHGIKYLMDNRHLWIRSPKQHALLTLRSEIIWTLEKFFHENGFIKFDGPMFTGNEVEGGSTLFEVEYFGRKAYLTQSAQLYGEAGALAFGKIYTFGPTFRAEKSKTRRHLTEFWMLEPEMAFFDWKDNIKLQEQMLHSVIQYCIQNCVKQLEILGRDLKKLEKYLQPFIWMHHKEAIKELKKLGFNLDERADLGADEEEALTKTVEQFIVLHHMPEEIKAFYMQPDIEENEKRVLCNDVLAPEGYGEIIGGSQRIHDKDLLLQRLKQFNLDENIFKWYIDLRTYGSVPHSGFGLGLERLVRFISGIKHIRTTIPFPRMINRLTP